MKIENTSTNFQGLRLKYQKFDHIIRNSNIQYSRISPYRIHMKLGQKYISPKIHDWLREKEDIVDENRLKTSSQDFISIIKNDLENVRNHKLGDCGESSAIVIASLIANAIKNFKIGHLLFDISIYKKQTGEKIAERTVNTTHEFVALNVNDNYQSKNPKSYGKNAIILDSWAGFCGNVQKAFQEFYSVYSYFYLKYDWH